MTKQAKRVIILIPTYNEKENIGALITDVQKRIARLKSYSFKILIVDGNSPDGTGKIVKSYERRDKRVVLLSGKKMGLGKDMAKGYKFAVSKLQADIVVSNEADFAFSFKHLPYMLEKINQGYDVVVASRHVGIGKTNGWTFSRKLNHWVANTFFARYIAGIREVYDKNGAFRAVRVKGVLDKINLDKLPSKGFAFFFYSLYELTKITSKFDEFPAVYTFRKKGESKVTFNPKYAKTYLGDIWEYVRLAFQVRLERCNII